MDPQPRPAGADHPLPEQQHQEPAADQADGGDQGGELGVVDRKEGDQPDRSILGEADEDVGGGLRRGVDAEPEPCLDAVIGQRGEARAAVP